MSFPGKSVVSGMTSTDDALPSVKDALFHDKVSWTKEMRKRYSPDGVCTADGSINQDFFKPKRIIIQLSEDKRWGPAEKEALYKVGTNKVLAAFAISISRESQKKKLVVFAKKKCRGWKSMV